MRVGIDLRPLATASGARGVGTYLRGLLGGLLEERKDEELVLFRWRGQAQDSLGSSRPGVSAIAIGGPRRAATLVDQIRWPAALWRRGVDVFHSPFWTLPVLSGRALVQTVHDLTPVKIPGSVSRKNGLLFRVNFACARRARRVIVPSRATLRDAVDLAGLDEKRIRVVAEGCDVTPALFAAAVEAQPAARRRFGLEGPYLIHSGGQDPVKNLGTAVAAAALVVRRGLDLKLVVTGAPQSEGEPWREAARAGLGDRLVLTGAIERGDLLALYTGAAALVYPSLNEGFGLPILEAMACGAPVVAARAGALPEVGGDACLYADPHDAPALAAAVESIARDPATARRLSEAGRARAAGFTWRRAARETLAVYHEAAAR